MTVCFFFYNLNFFISFTLIAVTRTSSTMLNKRGKSRHSCLDCNLMGYVFSFSPLSWHYLWVFHVRPLLCLGRFSLSPYFEFFLSSMSVKFSQKLFLYLLPRLCVFLLIELKLLDNVVLVSVIQWSESTVCTIYSLPHGLPSGAPPSCQSRSQHALHWAPCAIAGIH